MAVESYPDGRRCTCDPGPEGQHRTWCGPHPAHPADEQCRGLDTESYPEPPDGLIHTQDQFLTALDELLDNTLHDDACYIEPNSTTCVCILGRIRADLPPCGAYRERPVLGERDASYWRCLRSAHPASPDRHVFSEN